MNEKSDTVNKFEQNQSKFESSPIKQFEQCRSITSTDNTGFDSVVRKDRIERKTKFGPNSKKIKKPNNILIDIYGVIAPWSVVSQLKQFARQNMADYIKENWNSNLIKTILQRIQEQFEIDRQAGIQVPEILTSDTTNDLEQIIQSAINCIEWIMETKHKTLQPQINHLNVDIWSRSFDNKRLIIDIYPDVVDAFNYWRFEEFIKIYCYASGTAEGQKKFLRSTCAGDLTRYIANCLNSSGGYKYDSRKYRSLCSALRESHPENLIYFTDDPKKAREAMKAGLRAIVVNRNQSNTGKYAPSETENLIMVYSLADIEFVTDPNQIMDCC